MGAAWILPVAITIIKTAAITVTASTLLFRLALSCLLLGLSSLPSNGQIYFHGYPCTVDCSGHRAGYEWAERKGVADPDSCSGNSNSFIEGCRAWAEEQSNGRVLGTDDDSDSEGLDR